MGITISQGRPITELPSWFVYNKFVDYLEYVVTLDTSSLPIRVMGDVTGIEFTKRSSMSPEWVLGRHISVTRAREIVVYVKCGTIAMLRMDVATARSARND